MGQLMIVMFAIIFGTKSGYAVPVASQLKGGTSYLPPLPESAFDHPLQSSHVDGKQTSRKAESYTTSYRTNHNSQSSFKLADPQISSESTYSRTYHNSYSPQPSGIGKNVFLPPTPAPLPPLIPKTVLKQLTSTSLTTNPSFINSSSLDSTISEQNVVVPSIVMVDSSMAVLTPSQNQTIYAAKLLASSLLQEPDASNSSSKVDGFDNVEPNDIKLKLRSNDMFIVKAQKNAYIVPTDLNKMEIQELYKMRSKLDKAYTINQFIFIVKPEHINFLNKLV